MSSGGRRGRGPGSDERLSRLYQQLTEQQAAGFSSAYDLAAGLDRYRAWLGGQAAARDSRQPAAVLARQARASGSGLRAAAPHGQAATARAAAGAGAQAPGTGPGGDADRAVTELYQMLYRPLVRLAALLVRDIATAEEVVQDSFAAMHAAWPRLASTERALTYLRAAVIARCRAVERHRAAVARRALSAAPAVSGTARPPIATSELSTILSAVRALPARQREAFLLRFYADLSDEQAASAMGISKSAVRNHTARAISALRAELASETNTAAPSRDSPSPRPQHRASGDPPP